MTLFAALAAGVFVMSGLLILTGRMPTFTPRRRNVTNDAMSQHRVWLAQAGLNATPAQFVGGSVGVGVVAAILVGLLTGVWIIGLVVGSMLATLPRAYFSRRRHQRMREIQQAWPDGLRDLRASLASGRSLHQAIVALSKGGPAPLQEAFTRYPSLSRMFDVATALELIKSEVADPTTDRVIEVLILAEQRGGRIVGGIVEDLAVATTSDIRAQEEIETDSLQHRINAWAVFILPWIVLVALIARPGPFRDFYQTSAGFVVVLIGGALSLVGMLIVKRLGQQPVEERVLVAESTDASGVA